MTMPLDLLFIRHGESEANIVQKRDDHGVDQVVTEAIFARPDWRQRLTARGIDQTNHQTAGSGSNYLNGDGIRAQN